MIWFAAYVCGDKGGIILEKPYKLGTSLNAVVGLDIEEERKLIEEKLNQFRDVGATQDEVRAAMKELGIERFVPLIFLGFLLYK